MDHLRGGIRVMFRGQAGFEGWSGPSGTEDPQGGRAEDPNQTEHHVGRLVAMHRSPHDDLERVLVLFTS